MNILCNTLLNQEVPKAIIERPELIIVIQGMCDTYCFLQLVFIPPANKVWGGGYIGITLSVRPSMYLVSATPPKRLTGFL
jgi:hypothetical protein